MRALFCLCPTDYIKNIQTEWTEEKGEKELLVSGGFLEMGLIEAPPPPFSTLNYQIQDKGNIPHPRWTI